MSIFLVIVLAVFGLITFFLIIGLFIKKDYRVGVSININKPKIQVYKYLILLKNQDIYSKWAYMDKDMKRTYSGSDGTIGFISAWDSDKKQVGAGEQEITNIIGTDKIEYELRFLKPFKSIAKTYFEIKSINEIETEVTWGFSSTMRYPFNLVLLFIDMEAMIAEDFDIGLTNLKKILES